MAFLLLHIQFSLARAKSTTEQVSFSSVTIMGVGRRMRKQGPPPPLDESKITFGKKRTVTEADLSRRGKKRKASGEIKESPPPYNTVQGGSKGKGGGRASNGVKAVNGNGNGKGIHDGEGKKSAPKRSALAKPRHSLIDEEAEEAGEAEEKENSINEEMGDAAFDSEDDDLPPDDPFGSGSSVYDSDPQQHEKRLFSDDEGDSDEEEERLTAANIEGLSRLLDADHEEKAEQARLELEDSALQTNIDGDRPAVLGDADADEEGLNAATRLAPDLQLLRTRMTDTIRVLDDFSKLAEEGRSRTEYVAQLLKDICLYYGYSAFLAEKLFQLFPPREAFAFFEANETARPVVIRTNTLRTQRRELAQSLINRGVTLEPVGKWSKVGLQIFESQVPLGATPEYLAGHYILQAASSFLPVMALAPQERERILDMAAAPGGKTTYIAALMKNTGCIFANDSNKSRAKGLIGNIHRLGAKNTIVTNYDACEFPKVIGGFDRVLLDAPCSGTGIIAKDPSVKTNKTHKDFLRLPHLQKQLLLAAIDSVDHASKTGGYVVYSTCSVTVEENEQVIQYALSRRPNVKIVETGLTFGVEGFVNYMGKTFDEKMKFARRFYPHKYNVDGFFVCKLRKVGPWPPIVTTTTAAAAADGEVEPSGGGGELSSTINGNGKEINGEADKQDGEVLPFGGDFGGFNTKEDEEYIARAERRKLRRKGINPKGVKPKSKPEGAKPEVREVEAEAGEAETEG